MEIVWVIIGMAAGILLSRILDRTRTSSGVLRIDRTNPAKDIYRFDIDDLDALDKKKRIILTIDHNAVLSQDKQTLL